MAEWGPKVADAYVKAFAEVSDVTKGRTANMGTYNYAYADLTDVLNTVRPVLAKYELAVAQSVVTQDRQIDVYTTLVHSSGESVTFGPLGFPAGGTPQQGGSAVTYARRYGLLAALGLGTEDDDGHKASRPEPPRELTRSEKAFEAVKAAPQSVKDAVKALARQRTTRRHRCPRLTRIRCGSNS